MLFLVEPRHREQHPFYTIPSNFQEGIFIHRASRCGVSTLPDAGHDFPFNASAYDLRLEQGSPPRSMSVSRVQNHVPHDAVHLVKHYSTAVLTLITPFRHSKTPWHSLFGTHTKSCLAALTLGESLNHANLYVFYASMSISAFSLGDATQSTTLVEQGNR